MEDMVVVGSLLAALPVAGLNFGISCFKIVLIPKLKLGRLWEDVSVDKLFFLF